MSPATTTARPARDPRTGLRTSATLATIFTIFGHFLFGFEQAWAPVFVSLAAGYSATLVFETIDARANGRTPGYVGGGFKKFADFMLSTHMTAITLAFLLYCGRQLWIVAFSAVLAIGSKYLLRVNLGGRMRHFMNPSNFAIVVVLACFQWTGIIPWGYTATLHGFWDVALVLFIVMLGSRLNILFTGRVPTILAWLSGFIVFGTIRALIMGDPVVAQFVPLTGIPLILFTFYMITDPMTSPSRLRSQILFGGGIALAYSVLLVLEVQYTMFYAVTVVAALRGMWLFAESRNLVPSAAPAVAPLASGK